MQRTVKEVRKDGDIQHIPATIANVTVSVKGPKGKFIKVNKAEAIQLGFFNPKSKSNFEGKKRNRKLKPQKPISEATIERIKIQLAVEAEKETTRRKSKLPKQGLNSLVNVKKGEQCLRVVKPEATSLVSNGWEYISKKDYKLWLAGKRLEGTLAKDVKKVPPIKDQFGRVLPFFNPNERKYRRKERKENSFSTELKINLDVVNLGRPKVLKRTDKDGNITIKLVERKPVAEWKDPSFKIEEESKNS